jgi:aminoglycoside phosphotransferase (APT) family kinase protein
VQADAHVEVRELSGGVSNIVFLVSPQGETPFVLKQARQQLRVPQPWFCGVDRLLREIDVLHVCDRVLWQTAVEAQRAAGSHSARIAVEVPAILFEDRENYLYAMTAAPPQHTTWKQQLLAGNADTQVAAACGELLAKIHSQTWLDEAVAQQFDDRQFFDALRLDPYYRQIAKVHPELAPTVNALIDSVLEHRRCLVHGDFSPKNLLLWDTGLMLIDFEVGHYGDPAFDLGFFLTHLVLKTAHHCRRRDEYLELVESFCRAYRLNMQSPVNAEELAALELRGVKNLAGCMLARVDGKSRVDYLFDEDLVRKMAIDILTSDDAIWNFDSIPTHVRNYLHR